jgi:hypothetical protein
MVPAIRTIGLTKSCGSTEALRPLNLEVPEGEVLAACTRPAAVAGSGGRTDQAMRDSGRWAPASCQGGLAYLDQVAIWIADVAADLGLVPGRRGQEFASARAPLGGHGLDVRDSDVEEAADPIWVGRCLERDGRFVVGGAAASIDDDPAVGQRYAARLSRGHRLAAEYLGVEAAGTFDAADTMKWVSTIWSAGEADSVTLAPRSPRSAARAARAGLAG